MLRTPDEIKKGLECCSAPNQCYKKCAYACLEYPECIEKMTADALALIQQLESKLECSQMTIDGLTATLLKCDTIIKQLQAKCDAAVKDLQTVCNMMNICSMCKDHAEGSERCDGCETSSNWQWRGIQKEE